MLTALIIFLLAIAVLVGVTVLLVFGAIEKSQGGCFVESIPFDEKVCGNCASYDWAMECCDEDGIQRRPYCEGCMVFKNCHKDGNGKENS